MSVYPYLNWHNLVQVFILDIQMLLFISRVKYFSRNFTKLYAQYISRNFNLRCRNFPSNICPRYFHKKTTNIFLTLKPQDFVKLIKKTKIVNFVKFSFKISRIQMISINSRFSWLFRFYVKNPPKFRLSTHIQIDS